jgi:hypothetical protein
VQHLPRACYSNLFKQRGIGWWASVVEAGEPALLHLRLDSHSSWAVEAVERALRRLRLGKHLVSEWRHWSASVRDQIGSGPVLGWWKRGNWSSSIRNVRIEGTAPESVIVSVLVLQEYQRRGQCDRYGHCENCTSEIARIHLCPPKAQNLGPKAQVGLWNHKSLEMLRQLIISIGTCLL